MKFGINTKIMKNIIQIIGLLLVVIAWLFPVIISFCTYNFWYVFLYFIWWFPASVVTGLVVTITDELCK